MSIPELKAAVADYKVKLELRAGKLVNSSPMGPVDMSIIDTLVAALEQQERRIKELEAKSGRF